MKITFLKQKKVPLLALIGIIVIFSLVLIYPSFQKHPLGGKTEYLGIESYGRAPFTDSPRFDTYYYGTDMEPKELARYFHGEIVNIRGLAVGSAEYAIQLANGNEVTVQFYKDKNNSYSNPPRWAKDTDRKYFFFIIDGYYDDLEQVVAE